MMPAWSSLKDDEIAAVIDHVLTTWGNNQQLPKDFKPVVPADIAAARAENLTPEQVYAMREQGAAPAGKAAHTKQTAPSFTQAHNRRNLLAAVAAARALGYTPSGPLRLAQTARGGEGVLGGRTYVGSVVHSAAHHCWR